MTQFALIGTSGNSADYKDRTSEKFIRLKTSTARKTVDGIGCNNVRTEVIYNADSPITSGGRTGVDKLSIRVASSGSNLSYAAMASALADMAARLTALANADAHKGFINVNPSVLDV